MIHIAGQLAEELAPDSIFGSLEVASRFLEADKVGISPGRGGQGLDALELRIPQWQVRPVKVSAVRSAFFDDRARFPSGSVSFDCAVHMSSIEHEWLGAPTPGNGSHSPAR